MWQHSGYSYPCKTKSSQETQRSLQQFLEPDRRLTTSTLIRDRQERGGEQEVFRGESDGLSSPTPLQDDSTRDDAETKNDFWSITGDFIYRHHVEPRVKLYVPRTESFPIPLKYIDVTRTTRTSHTEDYWNVDEDRGLSDAWTGITRFIFLNERPPDGYTWFGRQCMARYVEAYV